MTPEKQLADLVDLDSGVYRLTSWEVEFVDSCEKRTRAGKPLSAKQQDTISTIWDAAFIHGKRSHHAAQ